MRLRAKLATELRATGATFTLPANVVALAAARLAKGGLPKELVGFLKQLGFNGAQLKEAQSAILGAAPAGAIAFPNLIDDPKLAAAERRLAASTRKFAAFLRRVATT